MIVSLLMEHGRKRYEAEEDAGTTTYINHYSYLLAREHVHVLRGFDRVHVDGVLLVMVLRLLGVRARRKSFDMTSMAAEILERASRSGKSVYLVGGEAGVAEKAADVFKAFWPSLRVVGSRSGFFASSLEREQFIDRLVYERPDIVIVGMGTPRQEYVLEELVKAGWTGEGYTCGGFLHQTAKKGISYYPRVIDKLNLRWAYRVIDEPKLVRRYTYDVFRFAWFFTIDYIAYRQAVRP